MDLEEEEGLVWEIGLRTLEMDREVDDSLCMIEGVDAFGAFSDRASDDRVPIPRSASDTASEIDGLPCVSPTPLPDESSRLDESGLTKDN